MEEQSCPACAWAEEEYTSGRKLAGTSQPSPDPHTCGGFSGVNPYGSGVNPYDRDQW